MARAAEARRIRIVCAIASAALLLAGCGDELEEEAREQAGQDAATDDERVVATDAKDHQPTLEVQPAICPADLTGCRTATGRVIYVEAVDPDGDGDAHFILASDESISAQGVSIIDVRRDLRPDPLPGPGDAVSAAGPVHRGSYGQRQIEAVVVNATYSGPR
jgi:hypothetical protein